MLWMAGERLIIFFMLLEYWLVWIGYWFFSIFYFSKVPCLIMLFCIFSLWFNHASQLHLSWKILSMRIPYFFNLNFCRKFWKYFWLINNRRRINPRIFWNFVAFYNLSIFNFSANFSKKNFWNRSIFTRKINLTQWLYAMN